MTDAWVSDDRSDSAFNNDRNLAAVLDESVAWSTFEHPQAWDATASYNLAKNF
jgi:hypothetical protein